MNKNLKYKPRTVTDMTILRSMLLNINAHCVFSAEDYEMKPEKFNAYISALVSHGIVSCAEEMPIKNSENLVISDIPLFQEWNKNYKAMIGKIVKFIIPFLCRM